MRSLLAIGLALFLVSCSMGPDYTRPLRYQGELANHLDVLVARRSLFEAELAWTSTRRLLLASVVHLYKALGGGWSPDMQSAEDAKKG